MPISFAHQIWHGSNQLHSAQAPLRCRTLRPPGFAIRTIDIRDSRGLGIAQAVLTVKLGGFDLRVLTETKISMALYCRNQLKYNIFCMPDQPTKTRILQGDMDLVLWDRMTR